MSSTGKVSLNKCKVVGCGTLIFCFAKYLGYNCRDISHSFLYLIFLIHYIKHWNWGEYNDEYSSATNFLAHLCCYVAKDSSVFLTLLLFIPANFLTNLRFYELFYDLCDLQPHTTRIILKALYKTKVIFTYTWKGFTESTCDFSSICYVLACRMWTTDNDLLLSCWRYSDIQQMWSVLLHYLRLASHFYRLKLFL